MSSIHAPISFMEVLIEEDLVDCKLYMYNHMTNLH